ncbi:hypothetical protein ACFQ44_10105 [Levilactobacillus lanxiensis]|uniref:YtxH domain-containing protein n=1 Tax=Levilactobacillus lanxiensis TaxID=2799568 RepID=A0ABW4D7R9_9LACO|nr:MULTISPECIES: hypothetical protein [Levilactobacillus]
MAKHKLLAGLVLGGAAYAAYHALDLEQREALKDAARDRYNAFKDRAVDYAFYAADAADDFKEALDDRLAGKNDAPAWRNTDADETAEDEDDDIVLSSDQVPDLPSEDADAADEADNDETPASDEPTADKPV